MLLFNLDLHLGRLVPFEARIYARTLDPSNSNLHSPRLALPLEGVMCIVLCTVCTYEYNMKYFTAHTFLFSSYGEQEQLPL